MLQFLPHLPWHNPELARVLQLRIKEEAMRLMLGVFVLLAVCAMLVAGSQPVSAQDAVTADGSHHKVEFENDQVRVVRYHIDPNDTTALHSHPAGVQIMLSDHNGRITTPDGKTTEAHGKAGTVVWRNPLTHTVQNIGDKSIDGILVEPKNKGTSAPVTEAQDPVKVDAQHEKLEFENDQVRVIRFRFGPHEKSPMHEHPNNVQVLLTDANGKLTTSDGKTTQTQGKAGEAHWRPATTHIAENVGDQPFEGILVEIKGASPAAK